MMLQMVECSNALDYMNIAQYISYFTWAVVLDKQETLSKLSLLFHIIVSLPLFLSLSTSLSLPLCLPSYLSLSFSSISITPQHMNQYIFYEVRLPEWADGKIKDIKNGWNFTVVYSTLSQPN